MFLSEMTWHEINQLDRSTVIVAPFGSIGQHGHHLPLQTDTLIGQELARRLDKECSSSLLVLPVQWLGLSTHHMNFAGTISATVDTFLAVVCEILDSLAQAGFEKFLVLNSHCGNSSALEVALIKCRLKHPRLRMLLVTYWNPAAQELRQLRESAVGGMGHACEFETSLMLAAKPESVRTALIWSDGCWPVSPFQGKDMLASGTVTVPRSFSEFSTSGCVGDPRSAFAEKGERFFDVIIRRLVDLVREFQSGTIDSFQPVSKG